MVAQPHASAKLDLMTPRLRALLILLLPGATTGVFLAALGHRLDYAGHHAAGAGATMLLLAPLSVLQVRRRERLILVMVIAAIVMGIGTEATIFRLAIFDGVDFVNQSMGAVFAGICAPRERSPLAAAAALPIGLGLVVWGFVLAFG